VSETPTGYPGSGIPAPSGPAATGQVYSSAYLSPQAAPAPAQSPEPYAPAFDGYGSYEPDPEPYQPQAGQYAPDSYGQQPYVSETAPYDAAPHYGLDSFYAVPDGYPSEYAAGYPTAAPESNVGPEDGSIRERLSRLPRNAVLAAICVVLLLTSVTLLTMYVGQSGENGKTAKQLHQSQSDVKTRDAKIKQMDASLADAEQKLGSGSDQLTSSQTDLQKAKSDLEKAQKDLTTANQDKQSLTMCLKALTAASAETDPVKQQQMAQQSQQTCAHAFQLAGIKTS
jgi:peptidoglycan hydrolase CwlO-like protein